MASIRRGRGAAREAGARDGGGPVVVLVRPQLGENIGAAARAMLNCGLTRLRLVAPRDDWPNRYAAAAASGADAVIEGAEVFATAAEAVADLARLFAATARPRDLAVPVVDAGEAARRLRAAAAAGEAAGVLFGPERSGLANDEVALADAILAFPVNPAFPSLNLAHAVLVLAYEWRLAGPAEAAPPRPPRPGEEAASRAELLNLFDHLEGELDAAGFLHPPEKRPAMVRNLRAMFQRAGLSAQEVRTLHGVVTALAGRPRRRG
ncbi:MAG: RNA methyltransferase [Proteobacteria bacterium]|nr:RNA methyltransferase [Pseudomonadota bacterium]